MLCEFLQEHTEIRDLEIFLGKSKHVQSILTAIDNNYMIKTARLESTQKLSAKVEKQALKFRSKRIGVEMSFSSRLPQLTFSHDRQVEAFYPDSL